MKKLLAALCLLTMACRADKTEYIAERQMPLDDMRNARLNALLSESGETRNASITAHNYYTTGTKRLALVSYKIAGQTGSFNMAVEETVENGVPVGRTYICEGLSCDCLVLVSIGADGHYQIKCTCSSCELIIAESTSAGNLLDSF